jgi:hypothetical protein
LLVLAGAFLYHETRGTTLWFDEWMWALHRRGNNLGTFLQPHNDHLSLVPIAIYRLLFATAGLSHYAPYRVLVILGHLACVTLLFVYARRRVGDFLGLLLAGLLLLLGPAWQNIIWPFQIGWLISLGAGLGALLMMDRGDRRGDVGASLLLCLSLASSGVGVPFLLAVIVEVLWRRRWRDAWIVAIPLVPYLAWWAKYQQNAWIKGAKAEGIQHPLMSGIFRAPLFVVESAGSGLAAIVGLSGQTALGHPAAGTFLVWGPPLFIAGIGVVLWRLRTPWRISARLLSLLVLGFSFWAFTAITRGFISSPYASRYLYVGALVVLLVAAELARGVVVSLRTQALLALIAVPIALSNLGAYRDAARDLRAQAQLTRAETGALDIARPIVKPSFIANSFFSLDAGSYFSAEKAMGTPGSSPAQLARQPEYAREAADAELVRIQRITPVAASSTPVGGTRPVVESAAGGSVAGQGACVVFMPSDVTNASTSASLVVRVPAAGLRLTAGGGSATLLVRRFADEFRAIGTLAAPTPAAMRIAPDRAPQPWHLEVVPMDKISVCGLG